MDCCVHELKLHSVLQFLWVRMVKCWNMLAREVLGSLMLEIFNKSGNCLSRMTQLYLTLFLESRIAMMTLHGALEP